MVNVLKRNKIRLEGIEIENDWEEVVVGLFEIEFLEEVFE